MKIKKFKIEPRITEIYNTLKNNGVKITAEVETLVNLVKKEINEVIEPAVVFESFGIKDTKIAQIITNFSIPKNVVAVVFIIATLGEKIENYINSIDDELKNLIAKTTATEFLNSAINFVVKIIKEKSEENIEPGNIFLLPQESYSDILQILSAEKIGVRYSYDSSQILPVYTSVNYLYLIKTKK